MFDIGFSELFVVAIVALLVLGPERLPKAARFTGLWVRRARAQWYSVKSELENELGDEDLKRSLRATRDELSAVGASLRDSGESVQREFEAINPEHPSNHPSNQQSGDDPQQPPRHALARDPEHPPKPTAESDPGDQPADELDDDMDDEVAAAEMAAELDAEMAELDSYFAKRESQRDPDLDAPPPDEAQPGEPGHRDPEPAEPVSYDDPEPAPDAREPKQRAPGPLDPQQRDPDAPSRPGPPNAPASTSGSHD